MTKIDWKKLLFSIFMTQIAGGIGAIATTPKITTWYAHLNQPSFRPPNWLFGPVWTLLYLLMGIAFYLVFTSKKPTKLKSPALQMFLIQLGLNVAWSFLFFGLENPLFGLICIAFLWWTIFQTILKFHKVSPLSAYLLYPYLAWVSFASILNFSIWLLNK